MYNNYNFLWISANKLEFEPKRYGNSFEIVCVNCDQDKLQKWVDFHYPEKNINIKHASSLIIKDETD